MLDATKPGRIGAGRALPVPGDVVIVATAAGDYTGTVTGYTATRHSQQWTVETDDGPTVIVSSPEQLTLTDERLLPLRQIGGVWRLDVRALMARRERQEKVDASAYSGVCGAGFRGGK